MSGYAINLAKELKKRNNKIYEGPIKGTVISDFPGIKIAIYNSEVILDLDRLYFTENVLEHTKSVELIGDMTIGGITDSFESSSDMLVSCPLKKDDDVLLLPDQEGQYFYVIDLVRKLG